MTKQIQSQMDLFSEEPSSTAHGSCLDKLVSVYRLMQCGHRAAIITVVPWG